jgi:hypothetical protein
MRLLHPPPRLSIFCVTRDQLRPGSFLHKKEEPGNEVVVTSGFVKKINLLKDNIISTKFGRDLMLSQTYKERVRCFHCC